MIHKAIVVGALLMSGILHGQTCSVHVVSLRYPRPALFAQVQGNVEVAIEIDAEGKVSSAIASNGHKLLRDAAQENIRAWRFETGHPRVLKMTYHFVLREKAVENPESDSIIDLPNSVEVISDRQSPLG